jgi:sarcosine oxidase
MTLGTMKNRYDAIVIGVGAMGSAALFHLARRGRKVLGIEQFSLPHEYGSSHGITRIIRLAYYEHPSYVPLLRRAFELWRELQAMASVQLLHVTGSIDAGPPGNIVFEGSRQCCELHDLPYEVLSSSQMTERFPGYHLPANTLAVLQPDGGFLLPELCVASHVRLAESFGADVHTREKVIAWDPIGSGVRVITESGSYEADTLIVAAGAWMNKVVPQLKYLASPERQVVVWMEPLRPEWFRPECFPVFNLAVEEGRYYGFPAFGAPGFKIGRYHHFKETINPDELDRSCYPTDEYLLRAFAERYFPQGAGHLSTMQSCIFTNTPDEHFILDTLASFPQVVIASPCSGHGFKFASVIGEILADLADAGRTRHDISLYRLARFI